MPSQKLLHGDSVPMNGRTCDTSMASHSQKRDAVKFHQLLELPVAPQYHHEIAFELALET